MMNQSWKTQLPQMEFPYEDMKLNRLFGNEDWDYSLDGIQDACIEQVLSSQLQFTRSSPDRPLLYSSLVMSIDGRIAYPDAPEGPFIASKNRKAGTGSLVDWWILNLLRASSDALMFGANTLTAEAESTGHVYDANLAQARIEAGLQPVPWNVIPTLDGLDLPLDHKEFTCGEIPVLIYTSPSGYENLKTRLTGEWTLLGPYTDSTEVTACLDPKKKYVMVTGLDKFPDHQVGMRALKRLGIGKLLVESPTLTHLLIQEQLMDELFFNYSCVYVGGNALTIGQSFPAFAAEDHPHTALLSVHMHSPHFMYLRHRLIYD